MLASYSKLIEGLIEAVPKFISGIILLLIGWVFARLIAFLIGKSLRLLKFDSLMKRLQVNLFLEKAQIQKKPSELFSKMIFWVIMLLVFAGFAEATELTVISQKIGALIAYVPNILMAILILTLGLYLANSIREVVKVTFESYGVRAGRMAGSIIFYFLALIVILTALDQLQLNVELLTSNVLILIGGVVVAFAIGYGLSARAVLPHLISSYYSKHQFKVGQKIRIGKQEGTIREITSIYIVLETGEGRRHIPAKKFINSELTVLAK